MSAVVAVIVRTLVTGGLAWVAGWLMTLGDSEADVGANIGAGLAAFAAIGVVSLVWSFLDGRQTTSLLRTLAIWLVVAVLIAVATAVQAQGVSDIDADIFISDLGGFLVLMGGCCFLPAALGGGLGYALGEGRRSRSPH